MSGAGAPPWAERIPRVVALILLGLGLLVLIGWLLDLDPLKRVLPGLVSMKVNTALAFLFLGAGLAAAAPVDPRHRSALGARLFGGPVLALALLTLLQYLTGASLGIDEALIPDDDTTDTPAAGRMSLVTALGLAFAASTLLFDTFRFRWRRGAQWANAVLVGISLLATAGFLYGDRSFTGASAASSGMAIHTLLGLALFSVAYFAARPHEGITATLRGDRAPSILARRIAPVAVLGPLFLGALFQLGERYGWYSAQFEDALLAIATVALLSAFVVLTYREVDHADRARDRALADALDARENLEVRVLARTAELERSERRARTLAAMLEAAQEEDDVTHLTQRIAERAALAAGQTRVVVTTFGDAGGLPRLRSFHDTEHPELEPLSEEGIANLPRIARTLEEVRATGEPVHILDPLALVDDPDLLSGTEGSEITGSTWIPILVQGEVVGILAITEYGRPTLFGTEDLGFARQMGAQVGLALSRAQNLAERKLLEEQYRDLYENAPVAYLTVGSDGRIRTANRRAAELAGSSREELVGMPVLQLYASGPHGRDRAANVLDRLLEGEEIQGEELQWQRPDGSRRWVALSVTPILDDAGFVVEGRSTAFDVTDRRAAEDALRESRRTLEEAQSIARVGNWSWDLETDRFEWSREMYALFDADPDEEVDYGSFTRRVHPEDRQRLVSELRAAVAAGREYEHVYRIVHRDGSVRHIVGRGRPAAWLNGAPTRYVGTVQDLTEERRNEAERARLHRRVEAVLDSIQDAFVAVDHNWRFFYINERAVPYIPEGGEPEDILGRSLWEVYPELEGTWIEERLRRAMEDRQRDAYEEYDEDLNRWFNTRIFPFEDGLSILFQDITEQKRADEALRESEARLREAQAIAHIGHYERGPGGSDVLYSQELARIYGFDPEASRFTAEEIYDRIHPEDRDRVKAVVTDAERSGSAFEVSYRIVLPDGTTRQIQGRGHVEREDKNGVKRIVGTAQDVTEQHEIQQALELYAEELERSNRDLEEFATIASHDLQEPLRKVQVFGERLELRAADQLDVRSLDHLARMRSAAARMQELLDDLLLYSRVHRERGELGRVVLDRVVADVLSDLETRIEASGAIIEVDALPVVEAHPIQMRQLFQNLVSNALKFHRPGEKPVVRITSEVDGDQAVVYVADEGIGIEEAYRERIFRPFQRLHPRDEFEGSGMGLAVCRRIVERHAGSLTVEGEPGHGSVFVLRLPVNQDRA